MFLRFKSVIGDVQKSDLTNDETKIYFTPSHLCPAFAITVPVLSIHNILALKKKRIFKKICFNKNFMCLTFKHVRNYVVVAKKVSAAHPHI